jgi:hypothetical protein
MKQADFISAYVPYIDKYGLVQPQPQTTSENGIRFTCEALLAARKLFGHEQSLELAVWINERLKAIENCQRIPGVFQRFPGCNTQEGVDDYYAASCIGKLFNRKFITNSYKHGLNNFGVFKSTPSSSVFTLSGNPFLWLQPGLYIHMKNCAGFKLNCMNLEYLKLAILSSAKSPHQDHKMLTWFIIEASTEYRELDDAIAVWRKKLKEQYGSIGGVLGEYFDPEHYNHPNSRFLMSEGIS